MKLLITSIAVLSFYVPSLFGLSQSINLLDENFDGYSASAFLDSWAVSSTNDGRVDLVASPEDPSDLRIRLDDSRNDEVFSHNVISKTVTFPDAFQSLRLEFDYFGENDEAHTYANLSSTRSFDGMVLKSDGQVLYRRDAGSFSEGRNMLTFSSESFYESGYIQPSNLEGGKTLTIEFHQYDNFSYPYDGIFFDNVKLSGQTRQAIIIENPYLISESDTTFTIPVLYLPIPDSDTVIQLWDETTGLQHGSAVLPAGEALAFLKFPGFDDAVIDGLEQRTLWVSDGISRTESFQIKIEDDEKVGLNLTVPLEVEELGGNQSGTIRLANSGELTRSVNIYLESSHPEIISVPSYVRFPSYSDENASRSFSLVPTVNPELTGDIEVTITARFGSEVVSATSLVVEGNTREPHVAGPDTVEEGTSDIPYQVFINGIFSEDTLVELSSSDSRLQLSTSTLVIPALQQVGSFTVSLPENSIDDGNYTIELVAEVVNQPPSSFVITAIDNDASFFATNLSDFVQRDSNFSLTLQAKNRDGSEINNFEGDVTISLYDSLTDTETVLLDDVAVTSGVADLILNIPSTAIGNIVRIRSEEGILSEVGPILSFSKINFSANDILHDSSSGLIYAISGVDALSGHLNSLTPIDPSDASIGTPLFLGNNPSVMDITDNSQFIYVGLRSNHSVSKINLSEFNVASTFTLGATSVWSDDAFYPTQILTLPERPNAIIVSQDHVSSSYSAVHAYFDGILQTNGNSNDQWAMVRGKEPGEFYGYNYTNTGYDLNHARLTPDGFSILETQRQVFTGFFLDLAGGNDLLFSNTGRIVDGADFTVLADIAPKWSDSSSNYYGNDQVVAVDLPTSRVFYARKNEIAVYDIQSYSLIKQIQVPGIGDIQEITRYGASGLALRTDNAEIVFIDEKSLIPSGDPTDLAVTVASGVEDTTIDESFDYTFSVANNGSVPASNVSLRLILNDSHSSANSQSGILSTDGLTITHNITTLAPGESRTFTATTSPDVLSTLVAKASVTSDTLDGNYLDNSATKILSVGFDSVPDSLQLLQLPIAALEVNPLTDDLILATTGEAAAGVADSIVVMNPLNGRISQTVALPSSVKLLALSSDASTVYALSSTGMSAYRVNLVSGQLVDTVPFSGTSGSESAVDLEVQHGTNDVLIVAGGNRGVRVYDNGVRRTNSTGTYDGSVVELLPDADYVFSFNGETSGYGSYKVKIDGSGATIEIEKSGLFSGYQQTLESDGYYIYDSNGKAVRGDLMSLAGTFDLATTFGSTGYSASTSVEPERDLQRVYFSRGNTIASFDTESFLKLRTVAFSQLASSQEFVALERWGSDGFAAILEDNNLAIIRTNLVPDSPSEFDFDVNLTDGQIVISETLSVSGYAFGVQGISSLTLNGNEVQTFDSYESWSSEVSLNPGSNVLNFTIIPNGNGAEEVRSYTINYDSSVTSKVAQLAKDTLGVSALPEDWSTSHHDSDSHNLWQEIVYGLDPFKDDGPAFETSLKSIKPGSNTVSFKCLKSYSQLYSLKVSTNLDTWSESHAEVVVQEPVAIADEPDYEMVSFTFSTTDSPMLFFKLEVPVAP
jgi:hypothetical protein